MAGKRIGVLTSGGDAPGMNAAIRAVVRCALAEGWEVVGFHRGYEGLMAGTFEGLGVRSVSGIIERGGTMLGSSRAPEMSTEAGLNRAIAQLGQAQVDALVVIGGNGSQAGALALARGGVAVVGVASTIDNDLPGTDVSIGVDTALNIALESIDRLRTTASAQGRGFLVEVMGRACGFLALMAGVAGGAELILLPEIDCSAEEVERMLSASYQAGKRHFLVVVAEGARQNAAALGAYFRERHKVVGYELRVTVLGHVQRGGIPTAQDRLLGTRLGAEAVAALRDGDPGTLIGMVDGRLRRTRLDEVARMSKPLPPDLLTLAPVLAR